MRALAGVVAALAVLAVGCGGDGDVPALPEGKFIATTRSLTPRVQLFAEPVVARVDVLVDSERYDPDRVRVAASFAPYERDGDVVLTRRDQGRYTHLRYEFIVRCLTYECLPEVGGGPPEVQPGGLPPATQTGGFGERKTFTLKAARVLYDDPDKGAQRVRNVSWPVIQSVSRLNLGDTNVAGIGFPFEASVTPLPQASYRISPALFGIGLLIAALALLALPVGLIARSLRRKPPPVVEEEPELTPLERALRLVEWACDRDGEERRAALEALAGALDAGESELGADARRLAWSRVPPAPEAMRRLVRSVRESDAAPD